MPLTTLRTVAAIHWQALFIWRRKAAFHPRPEPPPTGHDAIARGVDPADAGAADAPDAP